MRNKKLCKKFVSGLLTVAMVMGIAFTGGAATTVSAEEDEPEDLRTTALYDDFNDGKLDSDNWVVAMRNWGGYVTVDGERKLYNNGVVPENVHVQDGKLILTGHGNLYEGDILGVDRQQNRTEGQRVGAAIASKDYFASGSYEVKAKVPANIGSCSAIWTFEYEEYYPGQEGFTGNGEYSVVNHEIDIEMPGRVSEGDYSSVSYDYALCNSWIGENWYESETHYTKLPSAQNDGEWHTYRFDWHTGSDTETPRVEYYIDDVLVQTNTTYVPTNAGRLWLGLWFPRDWTGTPDWDEQDFVIDYVKITPFNESGDKPQNETYPDDGYAKNEDCQVFVDGNPKAGTEEPEPEPEPEPAPEVKNGFVTENGKTYYYENDVMQTGWKVIDGNTYYFLPDTGVMIANRYKLVSGVGYHFDADGKLVKGGWTHYPKGSRYYWAGEYATGWTDVEGVTYYFDANGYMAKGTIMLDGVAYTFDDNGAYLSKDESYTGFIVEKSSKYYYVDSVKVTGWQKIDGNYYYFNPAENGKLRTSNKIVNGAFYYINSDGTSDGIGRIVNPKGTRLYRASKLIKNEVVTFHGIQYKVDKKGWATKITE